jgi:DNA repair exonuclease SbcCD ATPase subunit
VNMGRKAAITYEQVKAVVDALRAEGAKPTIDQVWEAFDRAGSKGTIHKLVKQYLAESEPQTTPDSLRLLPPDIQQVILTFGDQAAATAREKIASELIECRQEGACLADDNERLSAELEDLRMQLAQAGSDKAAAEGRAAQLANELTAAREQLGAERMAAEQARTALAKAELRLESLGPLEDELRQTRAERDAQREARTEVERTAAVLGSKQKEHEERVEELKNSLATLRDTCARFEMKNAELGEALGCERQARATAERELAVLKAVQAERPGPAPKSKKERVPQGTLWQGDSEPPNGATGPVPHSGDERV